MTSPDHLLNRWLRSIGSPRAIATMAELVEELVGPTAAVFAVDRDQNVVFWSEGAHAMLGFSAEEMIGQHCLKANRCEQCMRGCGVARNGAVAGIPLVLHTRDGAALRVHKTARGFHDPDGTFAGGIEVLVPVQDATAAAEAAEAPVAAYPSPAPLPLAGDNDAVRFHGLISADPAMLQGFEVIRNVAETDATVLIRGESGTGKELAARAVHLESHRSDGPFLAVNCAALSPTLLESELFGHVKGAFTGAIKDRPGLFRQADGGTLFLDEVAELPLDLQAKLLRVLQERTFTPVGGTESIAVDLRIVTATHRALRKKVRAGEFREDLMYRLRVVPIYLPPLRERRGDVELLLWHFISQHNERGPRRIRAIDPEAMRALLDHSWPGNVRELLNVVQYAFAVGRGPELRLPELPPEFREVAIAPPSPAAPIEDEAARIRDALARTGGHVGRAAELLGMSRPTFWRHRKKLGI
jgi:transcriptional regulator with PAS, ATPase and Fis domain